MFLPSASKSSQHVLGQDLNVDTVEEAARNDPQHWNYLLMAWMVLGVGQGRGLVIKVWENLNRLRKRNTWLSTMKRRSIIRENRHRKSDQTPHFFKWLLMLLYFDFFTNGKYSFGNINFGSVLYWRFFSPDIYSLPLLLISMANYAILYDIISWNIIQSFCCVHF